ncbi:TerC family protein [Polycladomyces subterraneus]|uniref:TerC family protein n=1 Tax=Polycladomyces subterraneus TaxID=1016997 RepID=A0ABT8IRR8_9BACL|nr:TerC family protein [Polycladomyces subterraneus]MDN4595506.1 TerC family protein [Polycladomyces subterraneus]
MEFVSALLAIIMIDLLLAGDNALVIGLAARQLPKDQQKKAIFWGTFGAIGIRSLATLLVVWLLKIPGLMLVGGLLLIWIAFKLLVEEKEEHQIQVESSLWKAIRTIVIADAVMGLDNVLAVAGAAHGSFLIVILGLLLSMPIMIWGSSLIIKWIDRFPVIVYIGSGVIAWTAGSMLMEETLIRHWLEDMEWLKWVVSVAFTVGVIGAGYWKNKQRDEEVRSQEEQMGA